MARASYSFSLRAGTHGESDLSVIRLLGHEAISQLSVMEVDFIPVTGESVDLERLLAAPACLTVRRSDGEERYFHGIVCGARLLGTVEGKPRYRAALSPKAALLGCGKRSRTFLDKTVPEIVKGILDGARIEQRWSLRGAPPRYDPASSYRKRECTAQYAESDLTLVMRLLEREGIFFYFMQGAQGPVMVIGDCAAAFEELKEPLRYRRRDMAAAGEEERLFELSQQRRRVPKRVVLREYDFERPQLDLTCAAGAAAGEPSEVYEYPGGYVDLEEGKRLVQIRLEEEQFGEETWTGRAESMQLVAGRVFEAAEHPERTWNQKLLAVRVAHQGRQQAGAGGVVEGSYQSEFLAIAASRPYRPRRRTARPRMAGLQTATVVGPEGEEIHTDEYGRVKLAFQWNSGQGEQPRSGWARVLQATAGDGRGVLILPRVGQEVVVAYQHGDPDRPMVARTVYNGDHRPPVELPEGKTRTVLRTDSSPSSSGYGYNELAFEDTNSQEKIDLHAQRDELIEVLNDKRQQVSGSEMLAVAKNRSVEVKGNQRLKIGRDDRSRIGMSQKLSVAGERTTTVGGDQTEAVGAVQTVVVKGSEQLLVGQSVRVAVGAGAALNVGAVYAVNVGLDHNIAVGGARLEETGGARAEVVGLHREEQIAGDKSSTVHGGVEEQVDGSLVRSTGGDEEQMAERIELTAAELAELVANGVEISGEKSFTVAVGGEVMLRMEKSGRIQLFGKTLTVDGQSIRLRG